MILQVWTGSRWCPPGATGTTDVYTMTTSPNNRLRSL
jgi:hypothetical protein